MCVCGVVLSVSWLLVTQWQIVADIAFVGMCILGLTNPLHLSCVDENVSVSGHPPLRNQLFSVLTASHINEQRPFLC